MAITVPATIQITPKASLVPDVLVRATPLKTAVENGNYLWRYHQPPLVNLAPTMTSDTAEVHYPIRPSVDGLLYSFRLAIWPSDTSTCNVVVKWTDAYLGTATVWNATIINTNPATTSLSLLRYTTTATIPATAEALSFQITPAAGTAQLHHVLVYPAPSSCPSGKKSSGAIPTDDGIIGAAGSPIHTEHVNRARLTPAAILADRWQQCFSFAQDGPTNPQGVLSVVPHASTYQELPAIEAAFPGQKAVWLKAYVIATVTGGGTGDVVRLRMGVSEAPKFDAGLHNTVAIQSYEALLQDLPPSGRVRFALSGLSNPGETTYVHAVSVYWEPLR